VETLLAISVLATFVAGASIFTTGPPRPLNLNGMALVTVLAPTVLMGVAFPLLCSLYGDRVQKLGGRVGLLFAVNTAGAVLGSLLPVWVMVPLLGIQKSLLLASLLYAAMGMLLSARCTPAKRRGPAWVTAAYAGVALLFLTVVPSDLCPRVFLATDFSVAKHTDVLFYREGHTGTSIVTRDQAKPFKVVYINANPEVPLLYADELCFKMLGDLGPLLYPHPDNVLMICFGGGIAAGAAATLPDVKSLTVVDLESSVLDAARLLTNENNNVLENPKLRVVIDDGRNYVMDGRRSWPVIISDSTHPKTPDSWVLYTQEFYRQIRDHLTDDGIFVQWVPMHGLSIAEYKIILRTFNSVFPHMSLWATTGVGEQGQFTAYSLLVATAKPLDIDVSQLRQRLEAEPVRRDLAPFGLSSVAGFLDSFVSAEAPLRDWIGDGPVNTDDLPYTYYNTRYARSAATGLTEFFIEPMTDIWPWLTNTGSAESAESLHQELNLRSRINCMAYAGQVDEAYALLPNDVRYQKMRQFYEQEGPSYIDSLLNAYWNNPQGLVYLATIRSSEPDAAPATRRIFERVLALDPDNVDALSVLGGMHSDAGDSGVAENYLRRAIAADPASGSSQYNLALLLDRTGRHAEALRHYEKAAKVSNVAMFADVWGVCLAQAGRNAESLQWFRQAIEYRPVEIPPRLHLAYALEDAGRIQDALAQARFLVKLDPENKTFLSLLAELEQRRQNGQN
jgi:spermidine synthase/tetratricopeptide (TPR) repeat protein